MKKYLLIVIALITLPALAYTATAYKSGENIRGNIKDCFYEYNNKTYVYTVNSYEMCPYQMQVNVGY